MSDLSTAKRPLLIACFHSQYFVVIWTNARFIRYVHFTLAARRSPLAVMPLAVANFPLLIFYGKLTEKQRKHSVSRMT